tara:strand:+ start:205 stop:2913 length:2709 start_codon:yes stop_codon:yes gene_type:complete
MRTRVVAALCLALVPLLLYQNLFDMLRKSSGATDALGRMIHKHAVVVERVAAPVIWHPPEISSAPPSARHSTAKPPPRLSLPTATTALHVSTGSHGGASADGALADPASADPASADPSAIPKWLLPEGTALVFNGWAKVALAHFKPRGTTLHFTFGSAVMIDFVKNWLHFAKRANLTPLLVGTADAGLRDFCESEGVAAAAISPELDVWTYERKPKPKLALGSAPVDYQITSEWKYFRHHNSDFLEMGLVKVAFLWELLNVGFHVLISDLDVVWINGHWQRWMSWDGAAAAHAAAAHAAGAPAAVSPPVQEASLIALADILVTTDELDTDKDSKGFQPNSGSDLNTGVVYFRHGRGALAMVQQWRKSMLSRKGDKNLNENVNDQSLFNQVVRGGTMEFHTVEDLASWLTKQNASMGGALPRALPPPDALFKLARQPSTRQMYRSPRMLTPCLPSEECEAVHFSYGTLPIRAFAGGHTWFNQNVQGMPGHEEPRFQPVTVHFTFQFGDTHGYPHGKRQRAREAALWVVDPPEYFTEGVFISMIGPTYSESLQEDIYRRFPSWSPQRHMFMDAPQRQAIRDLLGLATAMDGITVLPKLWCHCDRYWGFLRQCRFPMVQTMPLPFGCPQDALLDPFRWNTKQVRFREHTFLQNPNVPPELIQNTVVVTVAKRGEMVQPPSHDPQTGRRTIQLPYGTRLSEVKAKVVAANAGVRHVAITNEDLRRLCRFLGSVDANRKFNQLTKYILTESSRYCPQEDHGGYGNPAFDWQNPFTAYNCTWGFHHPALYPEDEAACPAQPHAQGASAAVASLSSALPGVALIERGNSTTCPRQMLCDFNVREDGSVTRPITFCNIEGYGGIRQQYFPIIKSMLAEMPDGRCPYPPGDVPGQGPGFDSLGHWIGRASH